MTPEQRYMFDITGYLHLKNALSIEHLQQCREAITRYINTPSEDLPPDFGTQNGKIYEHAFAFDKCLESLLFHPSYWSIVRELTDNKPRFLRGSMIVNHEGEGEPHAGSLHCAREDFGWYSTRYETKNDRIYCDDFVIFPYFYDVNPGDGGLVVIPGSHKAQFPRPESLFNNGNLDDGPPPGLVNVTAKAGDVVIISELLTHGALRWTSIDHKRIVLALRYKPHFLGGAGWTPESIKSRLSPETLELMEPGEYWEEKEIVKKDLVQLS